MYRTENPNPSVIAIRRMPPKPLAKFLMKTSIKALALFLISGIMGRAKSSVPALLIECLRLPSFTLIRIAVQSVGFTRTATAPTNRATGRKKSEEATPRYFITLLVKNS